MLAKAVCRQRDTASWSDFEFPATEIRNSMASARSEHQEQLFTDPVGRL